MQSETSFEATLKALHETSAKIYKRSTIDAQALLLVGLVFGGCLVFDALVYWGYYLFNLLKK
jgi:hypothetical protein